MDQPPNTPSEPHRPLSLTERLKAEANGHAPAEELTASLIADWHRVRAPRAVASAACLPVSSSPAIREEPTPSLMARRFAPEGHVLAPDPDPRPELRAPIEPLAPPQARRAFGMQALIAALILVALVPSAMLGGMIWSGMIPAPWTMPWTTPWTTQTAAPHEAAPSGIEQASVTATPGPATILPKQNVEVPAIALSAPDRLEARSRSGGGFRLALDGTDALPARSIITVSGLPQGATFSDGRPYGETEWTLRADEIGDLELTLPPARRGREHACHPAGRTRRPRHRRRPHRAQRGARSQGRAGATARGSDAHRRPHRPRQQDGVGRLLPRRARLLPARGGGGQRRGGACARRTYDPGFIAQMGAQGIRPEPDQAIAWYERAKALGAAGAADKIATLKVAAKEATEGSDAPAVDVAEQGAAASEESADAAPTPIVVEGAAQAPAEAAASGVTPVEGEASELVVLTGAVNVRESPSPNAKTVRVMEQGTKLRAIGRKGSWVQVTDAETAGDRLGLFPLRNDRLGGRGGGPVKAI